MIRETLAAGSRHATLDVTPSSGIELLQRSETGQTTSYAGSGSGAAPIWLKLVRYGNSFTAYRSSNGASWTQVSAQTVSMASSVYIGLAVTSHNTAALNTSTFTNVSVVKGLPPPWSSQDIGSVGLAGSASYAAGTFTVKAAGDDIFGTADSFHYLYQPWTGDGEIVARVASVQNTDEFAMAGVMFRETLDSNSRHATMTVMPSGRARYRVRSATGGSTTSDGTPAGAVTIPHWIKVARNGNTFTAYRSLNGIDWVVTGPTATVNMTNPTIYVGVAVTSNKTTALCTSMLDNVSVRLPGSWLSKDIGSTGLAGGASYAGGTFTVKAAGTDIYNQADAFHYVYRSLSGNGELVAQVSSFAPGTDEWEQAGVMIRETLDANSKHAAMIVTTSGRAKFRARTSVPGDTSSTGPGVGGITIPQMVKIVRSGSTFSGYVKTPAATTWTPIGSQTISMATNVYVGMAAASHNPSALGTVTIGGLALTAPNNPPAAPSNLTPTPVSNSRIDLTWADNSGDETGFSIERKAKNGTFAQIATVGAGVTSYSNTTGLTPGTEYIYRVRASKSGVNSPYSTEAGATTLNNLPTVTLTNPANGLGLGAPAILTITADAADSDGSISRVEFYANDTLIGTDTTSPYSTPWMPPVGNYTLKAVAVDNSLASTTSGTVAIEIIPSDAVLSDDFNDSSLDPAKWSVMTPSSPSVVSEQSHQLQVALQPNTSAYNGITSARRYDFRGKVAQVEVAQLTNMSGNTEVYFELHVDENNYYFMAAGAGSFVCDMMRNGQRHPNRAVVGLYDTNKRFWRFRHDTSNNTLIDLYINRFTLPA